MFLTLLLVTFIVALLVSAIVAALFSKPTGKILARIISDDISSAWQRYLQFAIYVVGISSGVRLYQLERYIAPELGDKNAEQVLTLTPERWVLELYATIIDALQGIAWLLLVFFVFALIAYVIIRITENRNVKTP